MKDRQSGSHAGNTSDTSGVGSSGGAFVVPLPEFPNVPSTYGASPVIPHQTAPDRPDLLHIGVPKDPAGGPLRDGPGPEGPLTTSTAGGALAHGAHHIRPRPRHAK